MKTKSTIAIFLLACFFTLPHHSHASVLDKTISVYFVNMPLLEALTKIEKQAGITFSFKSDDISQNKRVNLRARNVTLDEALKKLLEGQNVGYKAIGTQVILYKLIEKKAVANNKPKQTTATVNDTIRITIVDTIKVSDTTRLTIHDTIRHELFDTTRPPLAPMPATRTPQHSQYFGELRYGWFKGTSSVAQNTSTQTFDVADPVVNSIMALVGVRKGRLGIATGIGQSTESRRYSYSQKNYTHVTIQIPKVETYELLDSSYFVLPPLDTVWKTTTTHQRTTYTEQTTTDSTTITYQGTQRLTSIDLPIVVHVSVLELSRWSVFAESGLVFGFVKAGDATVYDVDKKAFVPTSDVAIAPVSCRYHGAVGVDYRLWKGLHLALLPSLSYRLTNVFVRPTIGESNKVYVGVQGGLRYFID